MAKVTVAPDPGLNRTDTAVIDKKERTFSLDDSNDTGRTLTLAYMYILPKFPSHGVKVGMVHCRPDQTFRSVIRKRISEQVHELALDQSEYERYGMERDVIFWGICVDARNDSFKDYYVHDRIMDEKYGIAEKEQEWFINVHPDELIRIFKECQREGEKKEIYTPRKEQRACIDAMKRYFDKYPVGGRFLMNCKMRFGKSFTSYKYCEEAGLDRVLILTFVPAVQNSWKDDLAHIAKDYRFCTDEDLKHPGFMPSEIEGPFVLFLSLQNYLGRDSGTKNVKERINKLRSIDWDVVFLDEYHFGAWNTRTNDTIGGRKRKGKDKDGEKPEDFDDEYIKNLTTDVIGKFKITTAKVICLSGTPFKALATREFGDAVYSYTYFDEQRNKYPNNEEGDFETMDPEYADFPDMHIYGYSMGKMFEGMADVVVSTGNPHLKQYFSLNRFFSTRSDVNAFDTPRFVHEEEVGRWLDFLKRGTGDGRNSPYLGGGEFANKCTHSLWLMPTVSSTHAMARLLEEDPFFKDYMIIDLSDPQAGVGPKAYRYLMRNMQNAKGKLGSIALTVNKLTLGVTVKQWSAVFVLKDLTSPEQYFQSIFRIQTPYEGKKVGYVFDFNIDRASFLLLKFAEESGENLKGDPAVKSKIVRLIVKYLPIYHLVGNEYRPISEQILYQYAEGLDSAGVALSKRVMDLKSTTRIDDSETIAEMMADPEVREIMDRAFAHSNLRPSTGGKNGPRPEPIPAPPDDFDKEAAMRGRNDGYKAGLEDYGMFAGIEDDTEFLKKFDIAQKKRADGACPSEYEGGTNHNLYYNAFVKGYYAGVNGPAKKVACGRGDGERFVPKVREEFGDDILWTKQTSKQIRNFVMGYLNDDANIPEKYRVPLLRRWYTESFINGVHSELRPDSDVPRKTVQDAEKIMQHILARLFEFLYISVYRETTFQEIFDHADATVFHEAVGITKEEFLKLNRYHIFEENTLNGCVHAFFVNESLGETLDLDDEGVVRNYRNSFDWFGFGVDEDDA